MPQDPGVYFFYGDKKELLYIGKATNLRNRVQSYFRGEHNRGEWISRMISLIDDIDFRETDSVLEALILESNLIKKHQPKYNTLEKDDKSFAYFVITKEEFPRVLIMRKTDIEAIRKLKIENKNDNSKLKNSKFIRNLPAGRQGSKLEIQNSFIFGPYTSKYQMQIALKIIRRIFPFHSMKQKSEKGCLDFQLGVCPGPYSGNISKEDYKKNIRGIKMILEGKKKSLILRMEKEMQLLAKKHEFEKAADLRNKIHALGHIRDIALMSRDFDDDEFSKKLMPGSINPIRVEAYDISNISGDHAVGSMIVFENKKANKSQYRKFKIKTVKGSDDVAMLREVLLRRFKNDWPMPDLVLLDGGQGHVNAVGALVRELGLDLLIVAVAKGKTRKNLNFHLPEGGSNVEINQFPKELQDILSDKNLVKSIMDEAHRFAVTFHRKLRGKNALI